MWITSSNSQVMPVNVPADVHKIYSWGNMDYTAIVLLNWSILNYTPKFLIESNQSGQKASNLDRVSSIDYKRRDIMKIHLKLYIQTGDPSCVASRILVKNICSRTRNLRTASFLGLADTFVWVHNFSVLVSVEGCQPAFPFEHPGRYTRFWVLLRRMLISACCNQQPTTGFGNSFSMSYLTLTVSASLIFPFAKIILLMNASYSRLGAVPAQMNLRSVRDVEVKKRRNIVDVVRGNFCIEYSGCEAYVFWKFDV